MFHYGPVKKKIKPYRRIKKTRIAHLMLAELGESGRVSHENVKVQHFIEEIMSILIHKTPHCVVSGMWVCLGLQVA
jgi:hypothetical protein